MALNRTNTIRAIVHWQVLTSCHSATISLRSTFSARLPDGRNRTYAWAAIKPRTTVFDKPRPLQRSCGNNCGALRPHETRNRSVLRLFGELSDDSIYPVSLVFLERRQWMAIPVRRTWLQKSKDCCSSRKSQYATINQRRKRLTDPPCQNVWRRFFPGKFGR